jgi:DNA-binding transcriptional ArsR family regulator
MPDRLPPDHVVAKALSHPIRVRILAALDGREASPVQIADEARAPLTLVSFHFRQLAAAGLITQTATRQRRGAVEHFYRLIVRARVVAEHV